MSHYERRSLHQLLHDGSQPKSSTMDTFAYCNSVLADASSVAADLGYGKCRGCDCRAFKPTGKANNICATCGHHWQSHM